MTGVRAGRQVDAHTDLLYFILFGQILSNMLASTVARQGVGHDTHAKCSKGKYILLADTLAMWRHKHVHEMTS